MSTSEQVNYARKRLEPELGEGLIFDGKDLTSLFLKQPTDLTNEEASLIRQCYFTYGLDKFHNFAKDQKILPFVAHTLKYLELDTNFWLSEHKVFIDRNSKIKEFLEELFSATHEFSCFSLTLTENFGALIASNSCIGDFCSGDVDIYADLEELNNIIRLMNFFNFFSKEQPKDIGEYTGQSLQFFCSSFLDDGFWINIIWLPVTRAFLIQDKYTKRLNEHRQMAVTVRGSNIRFLEPTSLLYFCALHISAGHYFTLNPGLRLYVDLDRILRKCEINWCDLLKWEKEDNAGNRISMAIYLSHRLLGSPIPDHIHSKIFNKKRNKKLFKYLFNAKKHSIQSNGSVLRRLYVELASDDKPLFTNLLYRSVNHATYSFMKRLKSEN